MVIITEHLIGLLPLLKTSFAYTVFYIIIQNQAEKLATTESEICFLRGQLKSMGIELEVEQIVHSVWLSCVRLWSLKGLGCKKSFNCISAFCDIVQFQKTPVPTPRSEGRYGCNPKGVLCIKLSQNFKLKKNLSWEGYGYFLEQHIDSGFISINCAVTVLADVYVTNAYNSFACFQSRDCSKS